MGWWKRTNLQTFVSFQITNLTKCHGWKFIWIFFYVYKICNFSWALKVVCFFFVFFIFVQWTRSINLLLLGEFEHSIRQSWNISWKQTTATAKETANTKKSKEVLQRNSKTFIWWNNRFTENKEPTFILITPCSVLWYIFIMYTYFRKCN